MIVGLNSSGTSVFGSRRYGMTSRTSFAESTFFAREFGVEVRAALCFVSAEWSLFAKPFALDEVWTGWPKALGERLLAPKAGWRRNIC
jgi:hypothetical protein